jgi:hypothetical protein
LEKTGIFREHTRLQVTVLLPFHPIYQDIFLLQVYEPLIFLGVDFSPRSLYWLGLDDRHRPPAEAVQSTAGRMTAVAIIPGRLRRGARKDDQAEPHSCVQNRENWLRRLPLELRRGYFGAQQTRKIPEQPLIHCQAVQKVLIFPSKIPMNRH